MELACIVMEAWGYRVTADTPQRCAEDAVRLYVDDDGAPDGTYTVFIAGPAVSLRADVQVRGAGDAIVDVLTVSCVEGLPTDPEMEELTHLRDRVW